MSTDSSAAIATSAHGQLPEILPGYECVERLGAGGYGEVWKVIAPGGLAKALKLVYGKLDEERAVRELKALSEMKGVRYPFILSIERIEVVAGRLAIVTELADGSLKNRFDQCRAEGQPGVPREELLNYLRDAADALDHLCQHHQLQHLDIKPENLLLVGGRVKVADFGMVKSVQNSSASLLNSLTPVVCAAGSVRRPSQRGQRPVQPGDRLPRDADRLAAVLGPNDGAIGGPAPVWQADPLALAGGRSAGDLLAPCRKIPASGSRTAGRWSMP